MDFIHNNLNISLTDNFQKTLSIIVDGQILKKGKFILFQDYTLANNFYYEITLENTKKIETLKIPYPFSIEYYKDDGLIYLDYRIDTILKKDIKLMHYFDNLKSKIILDTKPSKFYNKIVELEFT